MIHPLFRLIASEPQMVADHVGAYAELVADDFGSVATQWKRRMLLHTLTLALAFVAAMLIGVALMLWAALPAETMPARWLLLVVPAVPTLLGLCFYFAAKAPPAERSFQNLREQLAADAAMLRSVGAS